MAEIDILKIGLVGTPCRAKAGKAWRLGRELNDALAGRVPRMCHHVADEARDIWSDARPALYGEPSRAGLKTLLHEYAQSNARYVIEALSIKKEHGIGRMVAVLGLTIMDCAAYSATIPPKPGGIHGGGSVSVDLGAVAEDIGPYLSKYMGRYDLLFWFRPTLEETGLPEKAWRALDESCASIVESGIPPYEDGEALAAALAAAEARWPSQIRLVKPPAGPPSAD
jgi:hypothetical protein